MRRIAFVFTSPDPGDPLVSQFWSKRPTYEPFCKILAYCWVSQATKPPFSLQPQYHQGMATAVAGSARSDAAAFASNLTPVGQGDPLVGRFRGKRPAPGSIARKSAYWWVTQLRPIFGTLGHQGFEFTDRSFCLKSGRIPMEICPGR